MNHIFREYTGTTRIPEEALGSPPRVGVGLLPPDSRALLPSPVQVPPGQPACGQHVPPGVAVSHPFSFLALSPRETEIILKMHIVTSRQDDLI